MELSLPSQAAAALATFAATLITSLIALVNLTLSKESKISEMRREWIESLRGELADYFQAMRHIAHDATEASSGAENRWRENVETAIQTANTAYYKIRLRLNDEKPAHKALLNALEAIEAAYSPEQDPSKMGGSVVAEIERSISPSRALIDFEWKRVKRGERAYRWLRNGIVPASLFIVAAFMYLLTKVTFSP